MADDDKLMNAHEVARYLGVPVSRIYHCHRAWGLPMIKIGQSLRIRRRDLEEWLDHHRAA